MRSNEPKGMAERVREASRWHVLALVGTTLVLVAAANLATARYLDAHTTNRGYWLVHAKWQLLAKQDEPVDVLVLGDSSGNQGVNNRVLDRTLGLRSLNLATTGHATALGDLWMLREYVDEVGVPDLVLVVHAFSTWERGFEPVALGRIPRPWLVFQQQEVMLDPDAWTQYSLSAYLRLYAEDRTLRPLLKRPWQASGGKFRLDAQGFMSAGAARIARVERDSRQHLKAIRKRPFRLSVDNRHALLGLGQIADEHGIDILLVNSPVHDELARRSEFQAHMRTMGRALRSATRDFARLHHCASIFPFPKTAMQNTDHLTSVGSVTYAQTLAKLVAAVRAAPRRDGALGDCPTVEHVPPESPKAERAGRRSRVRTGSR